GLDVARLEAEHLAALARVDDGRRLRQHSLVAYRCARSVLALLLLTVIFSPRLFHTGERLIEVATVYVVQPDEALQIALIDKGRIIGFAVFVYGLKLFALANALEVGRMLRSAHVALAVASHYP